MDCRTNVFRPARFLAACIGFILIGCFAGCPQANPEESSDPAEPAKGAGHGVAGEEQATIERVDAHHYKVEGPHDFTGSLKYTEDTGWKLSGTLVFPTGGYDLLPLQTDFMKSKPSQVSIVVRVVAPPEDAMVTQMLTEVPLEATIEAPESAVFSITIQTLQPSGNKPGSRG